MAFLEMSTSILFGIMTLFLLLYWFLRRPPRFPPGPMRFPLVGVLPYILTARQGIVHLYTDWSKRYGSIFSVKLGCMDIVVLNDYDAIHSVMHHLHVQGRPTVGLEFMVAALDGAQGVVTSSGKVWKLQRQFFMAKFRELGIGKSRFGAVITAETQPLIQELEKLNQMPFDPTDLFGNAVANVISKVCFGKRFEYDDPVFRKLHQIIQENIDSVRFIALLSMFPVLSHLPLSQKKAMETNLSDLKNWFNDILEDHRENYDEENIDDLMYAFMQKNNQSADNVDSDAFNMRNIIAAIGDLFAAGTDSTVTTLKWAILFFITNPKVQKKFQDELDEVIGRSRMPNITDRASMPYIQATIAEVQRLADVTPLSPAHSVEEDTEVLGYFLPKGTIVVPNMHVLNFDYETWKEPTEFKPERHLDTDGKFVKHPTLIPFGTGNRQCLGEQLARMQLYIVLTHLLHRFTFRVPEGCVTPSLQPIFALLNKPVPYTVCAIPRD